MQTFEQLLDHPRPLLAIRRHPEVVKLGDLPTWTRTRAMRAMIEWYGSDPARPAGVMRTSWTLACLGDPS